MKRKGFWGFAQAHPYLTIFGFVSVVSGVVTLVRGRPELPPPSGT